MESGKYGRWAAKCGVYSELALSSKLPAVSKAHQTYSEHITTIMIITLQDSSVKKLLRILTKQIFCQTERHIVCHWHASGSKFRKYQ